MERRRLARRSVTGRVPAMALVLSWLLLTLATVHDAVIGAEEELDRGGDRIFGERRWSRPEGRSLGVGAAPSAESALRTAMTDASTSQYTLTSNVKLTGSLPPLTKDFTLIGGCSGGVRCVIDGGGKYRGFFTSSSLSLSNLELTGMSTKGKSVNSYTYDTSGAVVYVSGGPLSVSGCVFRGNSAIKAGGGAIAVLDASITISNSVFSGNSAEGSGGALILWSNSNAELKDTTLSGNKAGMNGGGAFFRESSLTATSCSFSGNRAGENGGGLLLSESSATIAKTSFSRNTAPMGLGGAIRALLEESEVAICSSTTFSGNSAKDKSTNNVSAEGTGLIYCPKPGAAACAACT